MPIESSLNRYETINLTEGRRARVLLDCREADTNDPIEARAAIVEAWRAFLDIVVSDPTRLNGYAQLKYSQAGEVFSARWNRSGRSIDVLVKVSRQGGLGHRMARLFRPSRARRNFDRALRLLRDDIATAKPLALIEGGGDGLAWLISEYIGGLVDLDHIALSLLPRVERRSLRRIKDRLIDRVALLVARLFRAGWRHRDLKASNIMVTDWDGDEARVWLVDLDGLSLRRSRDRLDLKPLVRLAASLQDHPGVTATDGARFLRKLLVLLEGREDRWRDVLRAIAVRAADYNRRAVRRREGKLDGYGG